MKVETPPPTQNKKMTLDLKQILPPPMPKPQPKIVPPQKPTPPPTPPVVTPPPLPKPKPKPKPIVEPIKRKILNESKRIFAQKSKEENNATKPTPKKEKKVVKKVDKKIEKPKKIEKKIVKKELPKKVVKKRVVKKRVRSKDALANFLMGSPSPAYTPVSAPPSRAQKMINQLYGPEFKSFTPTQKKFIRNNLSLIQRITQNTLSVHGYPSVAVRTQQQGTNVVSFYLHPNGDISNLRLKTPIGYSALDQNTLDVIRIAYKKYPLPNKKTKIIFYVSYQLY